jgi:hypothetical protein
MLHLCHPESQGAPAEESLARFLQQQKQQNNNNNNNRLILQGLLLKLL